MKGISRYLIGIIMPILPETRCFGFKRWLLRVCGAKIGTNVRICSSVKFLGSGELEIGDNTWIGHQCLISSSSKIIIGANCDLAPRVYIGTGTHEITVNCDRVASIEISKDIEIGNGCWLCANTTILPGVVIGAKCVVAAGAVVTKSFKEEALLLAGVPAIVKKSLR
uniref:acyltransferase n=1 Tax=Alistipes megaguti TaxID=2364787 RepID=UPI000EFB9915|nr:DapH/DapD/GlmU-related protein [Alistipes megaguti]